MLTTTEFKVTSVDEAKRVLKGVIPGDIIIYMQGWRMYRSKETDKLFDYFRKLEDERGGSHFRRVNGVSEHIFVVR